MTKPAIIVDRISKQYQIGLREQRYQTFREAIVRTARAPLERFKRLAGRVDQDETFWALKDVSFEVRPGEVVGIIGRNGAGKSTLLKILSRITEPSEGEVRLRGRVGSLLEVGTGFHTELTGRENIYLNGSILGMSRREIDRKFDEIVDFSGVERFIDTPIKRYSSGMNIRLGFAVAAHLEPEILIVDEVLAVGDFEFQKKCLGKMNEVATSGRTVLFVSHNMAAVESLCSRAILLESGELVEEGGTDEIIKRYHHARENHFDATRRLDVHSGRMSSAVRMMRKVVLRNAVGEPTATFSMGDSMSVEVVFDLPEPMSAVLGVVVKTDLGAAVFGVDNRFIDGFCFDESVTRGTIECRLENLPLNPGGYSLDLYLGNRQHSLDQIRAAIRFNVVAADVFGSGKVPNSQCGPVCWPATFTLREDATQVEADYRPG
jgi:lipopolysaccharide transport system ATP-binding protein